MKTAYLKPVVTFVSPVALAQRHTVEGVYCPPKDRSAALAYNKVYEYFRRSLGMCA